MDWVEPSDAFTPPWTGKLGMTFLPGKQRDGWTGLHWRDADADAARLRGEYAVDAFLLLVEDHELEAARVPGIAEAFANADIELVRFPIVDLDVTTDPDGQRRLLDDLRRRLDDGQCVVVACLGGLGRTGTIVACMLRDAGLEANGAIAATRAARHGAIQTDVQEDFVRGWVR